MNTLSVPASATASMPAMHIACIVSCGPLRTPKSYSLSPFYSQENRGGIVYALLKVAQLPGTEVRLPNQGGSSLSNPTLVISLALFYR